MLNKLKIAELFTLKNILQFAKYFTVGILSFLLEFSLLYTFTEATKFYYLIANGMAYIIVFWFNFLLNRLWSFQSKGNLKRQLILYLCLFAFNIVIPNIFLFYFLTDIVGLYYMFSKVIVVGLIVCWNFFLYKYVIYK